MKDKQDRIPQKIKIDEKTFLVHCFEVILFKKDKIEASQQNNKNAKKERTKKEVNQGRNKQRKAEDTESEKGECKNKLGRRKGRH